MRAVCLTVLLIQGCHWTVPLSPGPAPETVAVRDGPPRADLDAEAVGDGNGVTDGPLPADARAGDGPAPVDKGAESDLGCPLPVPGTCTSSAAWSDSSGNCGTYECEKSCGELTIVCAQSVLGGKTTCECFWCGVSQGAPVPYMGHADAAMSSALNAGFCLPP